MQNGLWNYVIDWIQTREEPMHFFIEGGAGGGNAQVTNAVHEWMTWYYHTQLDEIPDDLHVIIVVLTGNPAYHIKGNTIHSTLHIDINKSKLALLNNSEWNTLKFSYGSRKAISYEVVSIIDKKLFKQWDTATNKGDKMFVGSLHINTLQDFYKIAWQRDIYIFKYDDKDYGSLTVNLCTDHFIYTNWLKLCDKNCIDTKLVKPHKMMNTFLTYVKRGWWKVYIKCMTFFSV